MAATVAGSDRGRLRAAGTALRAAAVLTAVMLLTGCLGNDTSGANAPVTGDSAGNGYGGRGGNGYSSDGSSADGDTGFVVGSGRLTSRLISLSGVNSVVVGAGFVVRLDIGGSEQAKITMDDNLTDRVQATVTGDRLVLGLTPGVPVRDATMTAEVTVGQLDRLATSGVSRVMLASAPAGPALDLTSDGTSAVTGPIRVDRLHATASGTATVALSGLATDVDLSGSGASRLLLADLAVRNLEVDLSGTSHATVTVSDTLAAQTGGVSVLRYRGNPRVIRQQTSGVSSITRDAFK